jgi:hypothetical protein
MILAWPFAPRSCTDWKNVSKLEGWRCSQQHHVDRADTEGRAGRLDGNAVADMVREDCAGWRERGWWRSLSMRWTVVFERSVT